jgi:hypothetical protein
MNVGSGGGGPAKVPISTVVIPVAGTQPYNGETCNVYAVDVQSSNGVAQPNVSLTPPTGVYVNPSTISVPSTGAVSFNVYIPTTLNGGVSVTMSEAGYANSAVQIRS